MEDAAESNGAGPLHAGQIIDGWRLEEKLHVGGMAHLWRVSAIADGPHPPLIMKVPRIKGGEDPAAIVGFEVEQMILPALKGPHVPRYVARGDFTRQPYIVMERIDGVSLRPRLDAAPLPIEEVMRVDVYQPCAVVEKRNPRVVPYLDVMTGNFADVTPESVYYAAGAKRVIPA
jgi:hypothetical protein